MKRIKISSKIKEFEPFVDKRNKDDIYVISGEELQRIKHIREHFDYYFSKIPDKEMAKCYKLFYEEQENVYKHTDKVVDFPVNQIELIGIIWSFQ